MFHRRQTHRRQLLRNLLALFGVKVVAQKAELHRRRLDRLCARHQNLREARDAKGHVRAAVPSQMERIQRHLRGRLAHRLPGDDPHAFTWFFVGLMIKISCFLIKILMFL